MGAETATPGFVPSNAEPSSKTLLRNLLACVTHRKKPRSNERRKGRSKEVELLRWGGRHVEEGGGERGGGRGKEEEGEGEEEGRGEGEEVTLTCACNTSTWNVDHELKAGLC